MTRVLLAASIVAIALTSTTAVIAKGRTSRVAISGASLHAPVEITNADVLAGFNVWDGPQPLLKKHPLPGVSPDLIDKPDGFIIDWAPGPLTTTPDASLQRYRASFYMRGADGADHMIYIVSYVRDAADKGYVYLPGRGDEGFALNAGSILRGNEGYWYRASPEWQQAADPLIAAAESRRNQ